MDVQKVIEMCEEDNHNSEAQNEVFNGLAVIAKYTDDMDFNVGHDQIWAGSEEIIEKMTEEDVKVMINNNWFIEDEDYSWTKFV